MAIGETWYNGGTACWPGETCTYPIDADADLVVQGNVGIGTTNPWQKIHIKGGHAVFQSANVNDTIDLQFYDANDAIGNYKWDLTYRGNSGGDDLLLARHGLGSPVMVWDYDTGNVGIGTTAISSGKLVIDTSGLTAINNLAVASFIGENYRTGASADTATRVQILDITGNENWYLSANNNGSFAIHEGGAGDRIYIQNNTGNVGIGTITPSLPAPGPGGTPMAGNLDVNDVYLRSIDRWASQTTGIAYDSGWRDNSWLPEGVHTKITHGLGRLPVFVQIWLSSQPDGVCSETDLSQWTTLGKVVYGEGRGTYVTAMNTTDLWIYPDKSFKVDFKNRAGNRILARDDYYVRVVIW